MEAIQRLTEVLERKLGKEISLQEVGYETMSFTHEEIDAELVPPYMIAFVEAPIFVIVLTIQMLKGTITH